MIKSTPSLSPLSRSSLSLSLSSTCEGRQRSLATCCDKVQRVMVTKRRMRHNCTCKWVETAIIAALSMCVNKSNDSWHFLFIHSFNNTDSFICPVKMPTFQVNCVLVWFFLQRWHRNIFSLCSSCSANASLSPPLNTVYLVENFARIKETVHKDKSC